MVRTAAELEEALGEAVVRVKELEALVATEKRNYRKLADKYDRLLMPGLDPQDHDPRPNYTQGPIGEAYVAGNVAAQMGMHHLQQQQEYLGRVCSVLKATCDKQQARIAELEAKLAGTP